MSKKERLNKLAAKPHSDTVRPLGTPKGKKGTKPAAADSGTKPAAADPAAPVLSAPVAPVPTADNTPLASTDALVVDSTPSTGDSNSNESGDNPRKDKTMTVTLKYKGLSKSGKFALYSGLRTVTRMSITDFPDNKPVDTFEANGEFAGPRAKLTAEERKAARKAAPKPTLAELIAKREKALANLREKAARETAGAGEATGAPA